MSTMNYKIEQVPLSDLDQVVDLWSIAYGLAEIDPVYGDAGSRARFREFLKEGTDFLLGAYDGEKLAAVSSVINFSTHLGGKWLECGGIAGVATTPEYRRQKLVRKLMTACLAHLHERRVPVAALWPFSYAFYEQMGFAMTDLRYSIDVELSNLAKVAGNALMYKSVPNLNLTGASSVHERSLVQFNLSMKRTARRWQWLVFNPRARKRLFVHPDGYMLWNLAASSPSRLEIMEWTYITDEAFRDGLALLAQMDSQYQRARWYSHEADSLLRTAGPNKSHVIELVPGMMARVVHLEAFMENLPVNASVSISDPLSLTVSKDDGSRHSAGPGHLIQHVVGTLKGKRPQLPETLYACAGDLPSYCIEQY